MQKSGAYPVPGPAPPVHHLAGKCCTRSEYFTTSNCVFNFNFLALVVSEIIGGPKFTLMSLGPRTLLGEKFWHTLKYLPILYLYKCIGSDTKSDARQSLNCIKKPKKIKWRKTIFNMADGISTPCNVTCGSASSGIMTVNSPSGSSLQYVALGWHAMEFAQTSAILEFYIWFRFWPPPQSTCHSPPFCEVLCKSEHPQQKKMTSCRFSRWRISAILDFRDYLKSPYTTSYRSSIETIVHSSLSTTTWKNRNYSAM